MTELSGPDLGAAFAATTAPLLVLDAGGNVVAANGAAATVLRRAEDSLVGRHLCSVLIGCERASECGHTSCPVAAAAVAPGTSSLLPVTIGSGPGFTLGADVAELGTDGRVLVTLHDLAAGEAARGAHFLALVAHELRTPLTVVISHAELLAEAGDAFAAATRAEMASEVLVAAEQLNRMVDDLGALGMAAAGALRVVFREVDVAEALRQGLASDPDTGRSARLSATLAGLPPVRADPGHAGRALAELVANARQAAAGADPILRGRVEGTTLTIEVVDRGLVIPEPERATLFDRLARQPGQRRSRRVTPLGVSVARALIEAMGGTVGMRAADDGSGCIFWITLPLAAGAGEQPPV